MQIETSTIAREQFLREGKQEIHFAKILKALKGKTLTAYGIGKEIDLDSVQVSRRTAQLERMGLIEKVCKFRDNDGSLRMSYRLV